MGDFLAKWGKNSFDKLFILCIMSKSFPEDLDRFPGRKLVLNSEGRMPCRTTGPPRSARMNKFLISRSDPANAIGVGAALAGPYDAT